MRRVSRKILGALGVGAWMIAAGACGNADTNSTTPFVRDERTSTSPALVSVPSSTPIPTPILTVLLRAEALTSPSLLRRPAFPPDDYTKSRNEMVALQIEMREVAHPGTLAALRRVPRHLFVPQDQLAFAYDDNPLPIGHGQTISQPYIVGYMTEMLRLKPGDCVLEIGTGSGYQAAILAELAQTVVTVEIIPELAQSAAARLRRLGYTNVTVVDGDGYFGWSPGAPYDSIIVTAAAEHVPPPLIAQLKPGGRMAIPVGRTGWTQNLLLVEKKTDGSIIAKNLLPVRFVPLVRGR